MSLGTDWRDNPLNKRTDWRDIPLNKLSILLLDLTMDLNDTYSLERGDEVHFSIGANRHMIPINTPGTYKVRELFAMASQYYEEHKESHPDEYVLWRLITHKAENKT